MVDPDLQLLRRFRLDEATPPPGMQGRIEERLWQSILTDEATRAGTRQRALRRRFAGMLRPAVAAGAALSLAAGVAVVSDGGAGSRTLVQQQPALTQAGSGLLDSTAASLFGTATTAGSRVVGTVDLRTQDADDRLLAGPAHGADGDLDDQSAELARGLSRDPATLREAMRGSVDDAGIEDPTDAAAFHATLRWIADPAVPTDLRAAMLRSLSGYAGIDDALAGRDVLGRRGVLLGHLDEDTGVRSQLLLDASSATPLEYRAYTTTYVDPACPPGTVTAHALFAEDGTQVDAANHPWIAWPPVVAACGSASSATA